MTQIVETSQPDKPASVTVLGIRVDRLTQQQVIAYIESSLQHYGASDGQALCQQIITVNPEFVIAAQRDTQFRQCINEASLVVPDGMGIVWAARYLGKPTPGRVTGVDTVVEITKNCAMHGYRLYLLGAAPGVAELAATRLQELAPGLLIAGTYAGSPDAAEEEAIIERIRDAHADILCVAYGAPKQELWIRRNLSRLPVGVAMGVGGAFDFLSGRQKRAPRTMQKLGLEWLYRLYREPWRWRRMLALPNFAIQVLLKGRTFHDA
jgi:N-acetylglucosaminyldiphosphoundecaprenol N-acetyl-beta-D-mannosaminyltransferase